MIMKYKWRVLYKPPLEEMTEDPDTWRKVFYLSIYDCPEKIDLTVKIRELKNTYNMKEEYIILEDLEDE